ncbi:hypothetical protein DKX38_018010 [Salix brachista]|uniref:Uncharacterized protein n=1 Tax=Salix brachista TaxID=2182728 RepID=A0A5N5KWU3_9ROSI|nr:hypothetical protein DKX38_018010 [Salix brachista]
MALIKSALSKSKPCLFLPFTHVRKLNSPPTKLNYLLVASNSSAKKGLQATADDEYAPLSGAEPGSFGKILLSDVVVRRRRRVFWGRKWSSLDIGTAVVILAMHVLCLCAPFYFTCTAFWVASGLYVVTGLLGCDLESISRAAAPGFGRSTVMIYRVEN